MAQGANTNGQSQPVYLTNADGSPGGGSAGPQPAIGSTSVTPASDGAAFPVVGNVDKGSVDSGAPVKIGGRASGGTPAAVSAAQRVDAWYTVNGALVTVLSDNTGALIAVAAPNGDGKGQANSIPVLGYNYQYNGASWDRVRKPSSFTRVASSAAGNAALVKATAGDVSLFWGQNGAAITYLQIYNKATAPVVGTDTPVLTYPIAANAMFNQQIPNGGCYFPTGIGFAFTTDAAGTTAAAAAAVTAFAMLVA